MQPVQGNGVGKGSSSWASDDRVETARTPDEGSSMAGCNASPSVVSVLHSDERCGCSCHLGAKLACDIEKACCWLCMCGAHVPFYNTGVHKLVCPERIRPRQGRKKKPVQESEGHQPATGGLPKP